MVVVHQVIATASSHDIKVVTTCWPNLTRCHTGAVKLVVGILHLISAEEERKRQKKKKEREKGKEKREGKEKEKRGSNKKTSPPNVQRA